VSPIVPAAVVGGIAFLGSVSWPTVALIGVGGYVLAFLGMLFLLPRVPPVRKRVKDKELKKSCCVMAERLFAFVDEREKRDPQKRLESLMASTPEGSPEDHQRAIGDSMQEATRYTQETKDLYGERFEREVERLLDALERRGWSSAEARKDLKARWWGMEVPHDRIRCVAQHLENVCHNA
jgi:hypothetical protein